MTENDALVRQDFGDVTGSAAAAAIGLGLGAEPEAHLRRDNGGKRLHPVAEVEAGPGRGRPAPCLFSILVQGPHLGLKSAGPTGFQSPGVPATRGAPSAGRGTTVASRPARFLPATTSSTGLTRRSRDPSGPQPQPSGRRARNSRIRPSRTAFDRSAPRNEQKNGNGFSSPYSSPMNRSGR